MSVIHPITEVLQDQLNRRHFSSYKGQFDNEFKFEIRTHVKEDLLKQVEKGDEARYTPHLIISTVTPYRKAPDRNDRMMWTEAELVRHYDNRNFRPVRKTITTLAELLGPGNAKTWYDWGKANLPPHELENIESKATQEKLGKPFPGLINDHNDAYNVSQHYTNGALEERLPWFRCGTLTYETKNAALTFEINDPKSYLGKLNVRINLHPQPDMRMVNAVAWYMESLSSR